MTQDEKFKAISERLKEKAIDFNPAHISAMVMSGYLDDMAKKGLIESAFGITPSGKSVCAICEEFDWTPTDSEIKSFVIAMVDSLERAAVAYMFTQYRDNREKFFEEIERYKKEFGEETGSI